jgi:hypothetical protein
MRKTLITAIGWAVACCAWSHEAGTSVNLIQGLDIQAERAQIASERQASDAAYKAAVKVCFQKIAVNSCKQEAQQLKFQKDNELHRRELVLNDAERRDNSAKALKSAEEKRSRDTQEQEETRRREAQEQHLDKLQSNVEKQEERLKKEADMAANRDARAKQLEEVLQRQREHEAKLKDAARNQDIHQRKLQDAQQHRAQV